MRQLDLSAPALLVLGSERRFPGLALCAIDHLRDGREVTLHHWLEQAPRELTLSASTQGLTLERRGLRIWQGSRGLALRWSDVFMVEVEGRPLLNLHRLYDLPAKVARRLIAGAGEYEPDRDSLRIVDALRRAMARAPWGFGGTFYAPTFAEELDARAGRANTKRFEPDQADAVPGQRTIEPGDAFRFTAAFLRSAYGVNDWGWCSAPDERWAAVACDCDLCMSGRFVAIDTGRHFARGNVERWPFARESVSVEESEAFLAAEREQLGVDRIRWTVVPP